MFPLPRIFPFPHFHFLRENLWERAARNPFSFWSKVEKYLSPPQRLQMDIPIKIAIIEKQEARCGRWEERKGGSLNLCSLSPSHRAPRALFFSLLPSLPTTQRGFCRGERESIKKSEMMPRSDYTSKKLRIKSNRILNYPASRGPSIFLDKQRGTRVSSSSRLI